jgi:LysM repeat protein
MDSIKTAIVVTVLLVVGYAVYQAIQNSPSSGPPPEVADSFPASADAKKPGESGPADKKALAQARGRQNGSGGADPGRALPGRAPDRSFDNPADRVPRSGLFAERRAERGSDGLDAAPRRPSPVGLPARDASGSADDDGRRASYEVRQRFRDMMAEARRRLDQGALAEVHLQLSRVYGETGLSAEESRELLDLLDQLAAMVIYSRQHVIDPPYTVRAGETLPQIAQRVNVPWQLLAKINGVRDPERLEPGQQLKVVRGPFDAVVDLERFELVLMLGGYYAGRFPIGIGRDAPPLEGKFVVKEKTARNSPADSNPAGSPGARSDPASKYWIGLTGQIGIHGTSDLRSLRRADGRGVIFLGERDVEDVFDILSADSEHSAGSQVTIRR